jgi:hypothetical protein
MVENLYILGAGSSVDSGVPIMNNFIDKAEDLLNEKRFRDNIKVGKLFETIRSLSSILAKSNIDLNNIESILGILEMSELLHYSQNSVPFISIKDDYIELISETIELSMKYDINDSKYITPQGSYQTFINNIKNRLDKSAIITFNYDLGVDVSLHNAGIPYEYYLADGDKSFPLLKLHGSINWFEKADKKIAAYDLNTFFRFNSYPPNFGGSETRPGNLSFVDFVKKSYSNIHTKPIPFIVPPTWNKTMYHRSISNVWRKASECLSNAINIYVIGYSLPESDSFFRFLFSLGTNNTNRVRKFWVVNPDSSVETRFRDLLGPQMLDRFKFFQDHFYTSVLNQTFR